MSEHRAVPTGWPEVRLGDVVDIRSGPSGATVGSGDRQTEGHPMIMPKDLVDGRVRSEGLARVRHDVAARLTRYSVLRGDVLVTRTGTVGRIAWGPEESEGWLFSTGLLRLRPHRINSRYLVYYLTLPEIQDWFEHNRAGTAIPALNASTLGSMPVLVPSTERQETIVRHLDLLNEQAEVHARISRTAERARDVLAQLLIRGVEPPPE